MATKKDFRRNQLIVPFGPGSVFSTGGSSLMPLDISEWPVPPTLPDSQKIKERRLANRLERNTPTGNRIEYFLSPLPPEVKTQNGYDFEVPVIRFPRWMYCSKCGLFMHIAEWRHKWEEMLEATNLGTDNVANANRTYDRHPLCYDCADNVRRSRNTNYFHSKIACLVPVRFVVACPAGHIDDFPWVKWCHAHPDGDQNCNGTELSYTASAGKSGLDAIKVSCRKCGASNTMAKAYSKDAFAFMGTSPCPGSKPWLPAAKNEKCDKPLITLQVGGSNLHYSVIQRSITVGMDAEEITQKIKRTSAYKTLDRIFTKRTDEHSAPVDGVDDWLQKTYKPREQVLEELLVNRKDDIEIICEDVGIENIDPIKYVKHALLGRSILNIPAGMDEEQAFRFEEYEQLREQAGTTSKDCLLRVECEDSDEVRTAFSGLISKLNCVKRLREVSAFLGFTRLLPMGDKATIGGRNEMESAMVAVPANPAWKWRLGSEGFGEGIFIELDKARLAEWAQKADVGKTCGANRVYRLLHTLAHLLLREASFKAGYSLASLKERIYCHWDGVTHTGEMTGILLYTVSADEHGTLGGLARLAKISEFKSLLLTALERAQLCSTDPVCSTNKQADGTGAACYACTLLPETACEAHNKDLDRTVVSGTVIHKELGYFRVLSSI